MDCLRRDAPVETVVQLVFDAGAAPGLRDVILTVRRQVESRRAEILASGARLRLADGMALVARYDRIGHAAPKEVLTLAFETPGDLAATRSEATRLRSQTVNLQEIIAELAPLEEHWHVLPGPLGPLDTRKLALSSAELLSASRRFRRNLAPPPPLQPAVAEEQIRILVANDTPRIPAPRTEDAERIINRISRQVPGRRGRALVLRYSNGVESILRFGQVA